jgi:hypothetical protein
MTDVAFNKFTILKPAGNCSKGIVFNTGDVTGRISAAFQQVNEYNLKKL